MTDHIDEINNYIRLYDETKDRFWTHIHKYNNGLTDFDQEIVNVYHDIRQFNIKMREYAGDWEDYYYYESDDGELPESVNTWFDFIHRFWQDERDFALINFALIEISPKIMAM